MITLVIVLCLAGANCQEMRGDETYSSIASCERAAEIKLAANAEKLAELGFEVKGVHCVIDRPSVRG